MKRIRVALKERSYDVCIGKNILPLLGKEIRRIGLSGKALIVTSPKIAGWYLGRVSKALRSAGFEVFSFSKLPSDESAKSQKNLFGIYRHLLKNGFDRSSFLIALGGGVVGDVAGFAASTFMRGIPWIGVPTTLLAQVDSSIGGKTAIDLPDGKNLIGTFHQPRLVFSDVETLKTLPDREIKHALAEIIKYGMIWDENFFRLLEKNILRMKRKDLKILLSAVSRCAEIKARVVGGDERETKGLRAVLNYGHTFGHAFEAASRGWSMPHGEAVALGMMAAGRLACELGVFPWRDYERQRTLIQKAALPVRLHRSVKLSRVLESIRYDKKKIKGVLRFVLPVKIGKVKVVSAISAEKVRKTIEQLQEINAGSCACHG